MATKEIQIDRFDGGVVNDGRDPRENVCQMLTNFDALTDVRRIRPYRDVESGDSAASTSQKQNFAIALGASSTYKLFALGVQSGASDAEILEKDLTDSSSNDLSDAGWDNFSNNQQTAGTTEFSLFVYYAQTGLLYGGRAGTHIWACDPTGGTAFDNTDLAITYTEINQGLVHSKDDNLYVPYHNSAGGAGAKSFIAKNDSGSWTAQALTLPDHLIPTVLCEYGDYLAIGCRPASAELASTHNSIVFLWDRDASLTTLSESIQWGSGDLKVLEEIDGFLVGISLTGNVAYRKDDRLIFRYWKGGDSREFAELTGNTSNTVHLPPFKQKINNRIFFMAHALVNGAMRNGTWSVGRNKDGAFSIVNEQPLNNSTSNDSDVPLNFIKVGDYLFQSYQESGSTFALTKSTESDTYTSATSIYESQIFDDKDLAAKKSFLAFDIFTEPLASGAQVVVKYRVDENIDTGSWNTLATHDDDNDPHYTAPQSEAQVPEFRQIQFRLESTGNAVITGFKFRYNTHKKPA